MSRPKIKYLAKRYKIKGFFVADFFTEKAVAIDINKLTKKHIDALRKEFAVIPVGDYYYITNKL